MRGGERLGHWYGNEPVNYCSLIADFPCLLRPEHLDPAGMWGFCGAGEQLGVVAAAGTSGQCMENTQPGVGDGKATGILLQKPGAEAEQGCQVLRGAPG